jgi:hypothetical protein
MKAMMGFVVFVSLVGIATGLVMCIFRERRPRGKQIAFYGAVGFVFAFSFALFQGPQTPVETTKATATEKVAALPPRPTYNDVLAKLKVDSLTWEKDGFGTMMKASFVIRNYSPIDVKDIVVTCRHSGNSGTRIDSNTRTVYEVVDHNSYKAVIDFNMGFIRSEVAKSQCDVTGYSAA